MRNFLSADPHFRYCLAEGCESGQIHDEGTDANIFCCGTCGFRVCTVHDTAFHDNETCEQYDTRLRRQEEEAKAKAETEKEKAKKVAERRKQEAASVALIKAKTVACPSCKAPIQKNGGCDHMTCK